MLKGIDPLLSGVLLRELDELGHGETVALVDRNYPAYASGATVVRIDTPIARAAAALLSVLPLDGDGSVVAMAAPPGVVVAGHASVLEVARRDHDVGLLATVERFAFYERAREARVVVLTREDEPYNDFLFIKGVVSRGEEVWPNEARPHPVVSESR